MPQRIGLEGQAAVLIIRLGMEGEIDPQLLVLDGVLEGIDQIPDQRFDLHHRDGHLGRREVYGAAERA